MAAVESAVEVETEAKSALEAKAVKPGMMATMRLAWALSAQDLTAQATSHVARLVTHIVWGARATRLLVAMARWVKAWTTPAGFDWEEGREEVRRPHRSCHSLSVVRSRSVFSLFFSRAAGRYPAMVERTLPGWVVAMVRRHQQHWVGILEPGPPAQRWRLYRAFDGVDGGGGASRLQRWSRLALARSRTRR
jgi:hypothetical protein